MKRFLILVMCVVGSIVGASFFIPFSTTSVDIVKLESASEFIVLKRDSIIRQKVHLSKGAYSGIALYANAPTLAGRVLRVHIEDKQGNHIASGRGAKTSYSGNADVLRIEIPVLWFTVARDDFFVADISLAHGEELSLRVMNRDTKLPKAHLLTYDTFSKPTILAISFIQRTPTAFGLQQGIIIGCAFLIGTAFIATIQHPRKKYWAGILLIVCIAPLAVLGYWYSTGELGIADWDFYFTLHDSYRKAIVEHSTFPFWNPYICGGTAGLGDPEFPLFSPTFLLELLFGIPVGIKFAITLSVIVGATGMLTLARFLGRSVEAGLLAALAVAFGTVNLLEITEGHVNVMAAMWVPWILWAWISVYRGTKKPIICGIFLAAAFLGGGIYLLMYTAFAFLFLIIAVREHRRALWQTVQAGLWALGFASIKLVPVLFWLKQFPDDAYQSSAYTLPWLVDILFGRHVHGAYIIADQASGWHEYGAYMGYGVFALALIGISYIRHSRIVQALVLSSGIALIISTLGPYLEVVFDPLWFFPRSNISRAILFAIIPIALLATYGVDKIAMVFPKKGNALRALLVGIIAIDIISLTYQVSEQAFILPHVVPSIAPAQYPIAYTTSRYDQLGEGSRTTRSFDAYKAGYGTFAYCSVLGPTPGVSIVTDEGNAGIVSAVDQDAIVTLLSWNYNVVRVRVDAPRPTTVVLNTNYVDGWMADNVRATIFENRVAVDVPEGSRDIVFRYKAPGFPLGATLSACTVAIALFLRKRYS